KMQGHGDAAAAEYRAVLATDPANVNAWGGLGEIKTVAFDDRECAMLLELHTRGAGNDEERATIAFALARALEDRSRFPEACAVLGLANAAMRRITPWDAQAF